MRNTTIPSVISGVLLVAAVAFVTGEFGLSFVLVLAGLTVALAKARGAV